MSEQPATPVVSEGTNTPPPFDPDPALVADREGNRFALRAFRKGAKQAHEAAEKHRAGLA
jgi:hypothetical protein